MYLEYNEYIRMGGTLDCAAFNIFERKSEYIIKAQANGKTGIRLAKIDTLPQNVKDCIFELVEHFGNNSFDGSHIQSESQSQGGLSESVSYIRLSKEQSDSEIDNIINTYLSTIFINGVSILYRGGCI